MAGDGEGKRYFYHSDHLGSSSLVTNNSGIVIQQMDYLPYGEVFLEKRADVNYSTPYKFNGKELDEETGLYYYGARYMNPRLSIWYGCDPKQERMSNISSYSFCHDNPCSRLDYDGQYDFEGTIDFFQNYPVIVVFQQEAVNNNETMRIDYLGARRSGIPIMLVENIKDFADAMDKLSKMFSSTNAYVLNSHGLQDPQSSLMTFYIGSDRIDDNTDLSSLKNGLLNCDVFIGACRIGESSLGGTLLIENFSKQTLSRVIAPKHKIRAGYTYDGSDYLNYTIYSNNEMVYSNQFSMSIHGHESKTITNVSIDKNRGITWDSGINSILYRLYNCLGRPFIFDF